jgi:hypothetical protein
MSPWPDIPEDVIDWFRRLFSQANRRVSETLLNVPSIRETSLDDDLIQSLIPQSAPTRLGSGAVVRLDVHNIGGLRRVSRWEVGDIGILVFVVHRGKIVGRKVAVLQAKRLYPSSGDTQEEDAVGFYYGMNALLRSEESPTSMLLAKTFTFEHRSPYGALRADSEQQAAIEEFERRFGRSVYYLFYNPPAVPLTVRYPVEAYVQLDDEPELGARILTATAVHNVLHALAAGTTPTLRELMAAGSPAGGWRLEEWAADLLLTCREGRRYTSPDEREVQLLLERRSGPIGAAIAISIELPDAAASG